MFFLSLREGTGDIRFPVRVRTGDRRGGGQAYARTNPFPSRGAFTPTLALPRSAQGRGPRRYAQRTNSSVPNQSTRMRL
jgi:hypothetical protein